MFKLSLDPIDHSLEVLDFNDPHDGGFVFFEGRVRDHNDGRRVKSLEYQCYESMALKEGTKITESALKAFDIHRVKCIHRHGLLSIKEVALWVGVSAVHRREAFRACQYIIDKVKRFVPIWKKERYIDGKVQWVACHHSHEKHHERISLL